MTTPPGWEDILDEDETILWQGAPDTSLRVVGDWKTSAFGLFFAGFAAFWMAGAAMIGNDIGIFGLVFPLFGLPFLLIGLHLVFGRFIWDAYVRRGTFYTLTTKRAYVATATLGERRLRSHEIHRKTPLHLTEGPPGSVFFEAASDQRSTGRAGFRFIDDARQVYDLARNIQKDAI